jgi:hypothetical protein
MCLRRAQARLCLPIFMSARDAPSSVARLCPRRARGTPGHIGPACSRTSRSGSELVLKRDSADASAFRARCLRFAPRPPRWDDNFLPTAMGGPKRQHPPPVNVCSTPGKTAAWTAASQARVCARDAATALTGVASSSGAGAVVGANASGRSRLRYARSKAPLSGSGEVDIVLVGLYVNC